MAWIPLSIDDVKGKLSDAEYAGVTRASLPAGVTATDIVNEEITNCIGSVRGYVAGYSANVLGDGATIPDELKDAALVIIRYKVFTRLPNMKSLLDALRVGEYNDALRLLRDVAKGDFRIVNPVTAAPEQAGGSTIEVVSSTPRQATRKKLTGLL